MRNTLVASLVAILAVAALSVRLVGQPADDDHARKAADTHARHIIVPADDVELKDGPPSLPPGAKFVVLEGDPASAGMFTMRLKAPAGYRIPPHTHPRVERVTVLEGTFKLGTGRKFDENNMQSLPAGSFFVMPPGMEHFAMAGDEGTVVQLTGMGPWDIIYINPEDDPRKR